MSLSSLLHSWELNTNLYVINDTLYKDQGVSLFFISCIITASNPCQRYRCPEDSACDHSDTHFTCVSRTWTRGRQQKEWWDFLQYDDFSIFLVLISYYICCGTGIVYCPWILCIAATFTHVLIHREGEQNSLKHQKYFIFTLQASAWPVP